MFLKTKIYSGWIFGSEKDRRWMRNLERQEVFLLQPNSPEQHAHQVSGEAVADRRGKIILL